MTEFIKETILINYCYNIVLEDDEVFALFPNEPKAVVNSLLEELTSEKILQKTRCTRAKENEELNKQIKDLVLKDGHVLIMSFDNFLSLSKLLLQQKDKNIDMAFHRSAFVQKIVLEKDLISFVNKKMATNFLLNDDGSKIVKIIKLSPSAMRYCVFEEDGLIKAMLESEKQQNLQSEPLKQACRFRNEHFKNMILKAFLDDLNTGILDHVLNDIGLNCVTWNTELQFKKKTDEDTSLFDFNVNDSRVIGKDSNGNIIPIKLMPEYIKHFPNVTRLSENLILILGSYKPEHIERIETIKKYIKEKHNKYWPAFLKDLKQIYVATDDENLSNYLGLSRFVIVEDSFPGGKDYELGILNQHPGIVTILLREEGKASTSMTNDFGVNRPRTKRFDYKMNNFNDIIDKSIAEAEEMLLKKKESLDGN